MWSLMLGCIFILRFQTMRSMRNASQWAEAAEGTTASIIWNVWVFLSMPAVFLCWSLVSFIISILAFVWTSGTVNPPSSISSTAAIGPRIFVTFTFVLGLVYFATAIRTFKSYTDSTEASEASRAVIEGRDRRAWSPRIRVLRNRPEDDLEKGLGSLEVGQAKKNIHGANGVNAGTHESGTGWDEILSPTGTMNARGRAPRDVVSPKMLLAGPFPRGTSV
ncbi:uncharacterized protein EI90DRAFT_3064483 [Cantharellus anzutake]|uniref:uncharacterized protein n=1 Tax=Cantharellus anzutake TaxID=1750568 RepID=UPI0019053FD7|nr:uncharacterized protein EI90DRAFT_3064483 [Cantharellus anzutake]KAF8328531.1 hypothetical protein EI90DRAFT_3064483 [Cantharellus anzutake]